MSRWRGGIRQGWRLLKLLGFFRLKPYQLLDVEYLDCIDYQSNPNQLSAISATDGEAVLIIKIGIFRRARRFKTLYLALICHFVLHVVIARTESLSDLISIIIIMCQDKIRVMH